MIEQKNKPAEMKIPYFRPPVTCREGYYKLLDEVFDSAIFTNNGPKVTSLERKIADLHRYEYCAIVTNATIGLQLLFKCLNLKNKVITTPFTFVATASSLVWEGAEPYFVDIEEDKLTIDANEVSKQICNETKAVLGVNVFGNVCDYDEISWLCRKNNLYEIYDSAHSFGIVDSKNNKNNAIEILSFHSTKVFSTVEGGAILTNNKELYEKIIKVRNFGFSGMDHVTLVGTNAKMDEFRASYGIHQLESIEKIRYRLKDIQIKYLLELDKLPEISFVGNRDLNSNYHYFPIRINGRGKGITRDDVWGYLWSQGIQTRRYFYPIISSFEPYSKYSGKTPVAKNASEEILCLPCYFDLSDEMIFEVTKQIKLCLSMEKSKIDKIIKTNYEESYFFPVAQSLENKKIFGY